MEGRGRGLGDGESGGETGAAAAPQTMGRGVLRVMVVVVVGGGREGNLDVEHCPCPLVDGVSPRLIVDTGRGRN